jgi:hypothetical protein
MANSWSMGTISEDSRIAPSSSSIISSVIPSRTHMEATSANTIEGVKQPSAFSTASRAWKAAGPLRIISAQAKVSIVRFNAIGLCEPVELTFAASDEAVQGAGSSFANQLTDGFVGGTDVECLSNLIETA